MVRILDSHMCVGYCCGPSSKTKRVQKRMTSINGDETTTNSGNPVRQVVSDDVGVFDGFISSNSIMSETHRYLILSGYRNVFVSLFQLPTPRLPGHIERPVNRQMAAAGRRGERRIWFLRLCFPCYRQMMVGRQRRRERHI
ncbi:hypothetical protein CHS0354_032423 [Potamilus streckersoni]|uniref:Uncharacterized protein n=1 Tax=Potamilus streckersoni TaxID=2493646 RepID=A0AAE0SQE4_9BIVA|nr:hypothetical protein CHS0354_032423 [Potamilus streckersoni]